MESREEWIREWGVTERRLEGGMSTAAAVQQLYKYRYAVCEFLVEGTNSVN